MKKRPVIGLTGNIGSGKSTAASFFAEKGLVIIDGDNLGRDVVNQSQNFQNWLRIRYGDSIFDGNVLNRAALGRIVFSDPVAKDDLNKNIWPYIRDLISQKVKSAHQNKCIPLIDAAMIYEWEDEARYDLIIAVIVQPETGVKRAAKRMGLSEKELMDRYKMQVPFEIKAEKADIVIQNDGSQQELLDKLEVSWKEKISPFIEGFKNNT